MWPSFTNKPNLRPYRAITPTVVPFGEPGFPTNTAASPLAAESEHMNFSKPDAAPEELLSEATWKSVRGAGSEMPEPVHTLLDPPQPGSETRSD